MKDESSHHPLEIPYARMIHSGKNIHVPESARTIGAWIHGNSSWGRVIFELEDAQGMRWLSIRGYVFIDFDGWRYVEVPLPHAPHGMNAERTGVDPWVNDAGMEDLKYPMTLKGLIFETLSHVIYADQLRPVTDRFHYVDRIVINED